MRRVLASDSSVMWLASACSASMSRLDMATPNWEKLETFRCPLAVCSPPPARHRDGACRGHGCCGMRQVWRGCLWLFLQSDAAEARSGRCSPQRSAAPSRFRSARLLEEALTLACCQDGDALHPPSNVAKMRAGAPLTDVDRWPWLQAVNRCLCSWASGRQQGVVACSALKREYRDILRQDVRASSSCLLVNSQARRSTHPWCFCTLTCVSRRRAIAVA